MRMIRFENSKILMDIDGRPLFWVSELVPFIFILSFSFVFSVTKHVYFIIVKTIQYCIFYTSSIVRWNIMK